VCPVTGQLKLHFRGIHPLVQLSLKIGQSVPTIHSGLVSLLLRLYYFAGDHLKALPLTPLKALATPEDGL
jgi:hypothetical protein